MTFAWFPLSNHGMKSLWCIHTNVDSLNKVQPYGCAFGRWNFFGWGSRFEDDLKVMAFEGDGNFHCWKRDGMVWDDVWWSDFQETLQVHANCCFNINH
jgi:hypothetical protein